MFSGVLVCGCAGPGVELIAENTPSVGSGRGVRFKVGAKVKATKHPRTPKSKKAARAHFE